MKKPIPTTDRDGYNLALSHFMTDGKRHGAKSRMAKALGTSRAVVDAWERNGIPQKYIPKLKSLTGLRGRDIVPELAKLLD
jgi:hypothetical protein